MLTAGALPITEDLHVIAVPTAGYVLTGGATAVWTFTYTP